jgi:hypothetical protein
MPDNVQAEFDETGGGFLTKEQIDRAFPLGKYADAVIDRQQQAAANIFYNDGDKEYGVFENQSDAINTLPNSLFYEAQTSEDGRSGLFNHYVISNGSFASGGGKLRYDQSELFNHNQKVTPEWSRNPTAQKIIEITTTSKNFLNPASRFISQPYNVKDFIFCKYYGVIPNNRMITLRRFPGPVMDNLKVPIAGPRIEAEYTGGELKGVRKQTDGITSQDMRSTGVAQPIAQAVTFFGDGTGNEINSILNINTGLVFNPKTQQNKYDLTGNDLGLLNSPLGDLFKGISSTGTQNNVVGMSNLIGTFTDPDNIDIQVRRTYWNKLTTGDGPLSQRLFVDVNTVNQMFVRGQGFTGGDQSFNLTFSYNLTSVGSVNSRMLFLDLLANLLAIGSDYGKFLTPGLHYESQRAGIGFPGGADAYVKFLTRPVEYLNDMLGKSFQKELELKKKQLTDNTNKAKEELANFKKGTPLPKDGVVYKTLSALLTNKQLDNLKYEPIMLSGYPTGEWHVVLGNPLNPIAMIGNLICTSVQIKLNNVLGPDDFPTEMTAIYQLKAARQKHKGDFESMLNRGRGRFYLGKLSISEQSRNALVTARTGQDILKTTTNSNAAISATSQTGT